MINFEIIPAINRKNPRIYLTDDKQIYFLNTIGVEAKFFRCKVIGCKSRIKLTHDKYVYIISNEHSHDNCYENEFELMKIKYRIEKEIENSVKENRDESLKDIFNNLKEDIGEKLTFDSYKSAMQRQKEQIVKLFKQKISDKKVEKMELKKHPTQNNESKTSKEPVDQSSDVITLTGWETRSKWQFPLNKVKCPVGRCKQPFKNRAAAIEHYKEKHAMNAVLCHICNKPINITWANGYSLHFQSRHPNEPIPHINGKSVYKKGSKSGTHIQRQINDMHMSKRTCCPLMDCPFTSKRMEKVRIHWAKAHGNIKFPEFREQNEFTYNTNGTNDESDGNGGVEKITKRSTSKRSHDSLPQRSEKKNEKRRFSTINGLNDSLLKKSDVIAENDTSGQSESSEPLSRLSSSRLCHSSYGCTTGDSSDEELNQSESKRLKMVKENLDQYLSNDNDATKSAEEITSSENSSVKKTECSVLLERLDSIEMISLSVNQEEELQNECNQMELSKGRKQRQCQINAMTLPNQFASTADMEPKEETNFKSSTLQLEMVCLDSDEEDLEHPNNVSSEAVIVLDSDDDDENDKNATHRKTMGVLMMAKSIK